MASTLKKILVVGGNGFIGSAICRAALAKGLRVTSVSSSGKPYRTAKGHTPAWATQVDWEKGDAFRPETFAHILPEVGGVVHTLGTLFEGAGYKKDLKEGHILGVAGQFVESFVRGRNPLEGGLSKGSYEALNRDSALNVCKAFVESSKEAVTQNLPRPFIYISAEDVFRPFIPSRYIETKRMAEIGIEALLGDKPDYRGVYIRPGLVYHSHHRPLTTPAAVLLDISSIIHSKVPPGVPTPAGILRAVSASASRTDSGLSTSSLESVANAMVIPPIHVDHVAEAVCMALDSAQPIRGPVGVKQMRELIGWVEEGDSKRVDSKAF